VLTYSLIWSNEDGGTNTPALMARWGRTTDIEWIYSVELDEHGDRVPGTDTYQAANHQTLHFTGRYEDAHAVLSTCTSNNNMCDVADDPMRFFLSTLLTRPADQPREYLMDTNAWTYQIMAKEMIREGKIEAAGPVTAATPEVSDQIAWTRLEMSSVARAVSCARSLTSEATTAKPLPSSPARAASIVIAVRILALTLRSAKERRLATGAPPATVLMSGSLPKMRCGTPARARLGDAPTVSPRLPHHHHRCPRPLCGRKTVKSRANRAGAGGDARQERLGEPKGR